MICKGYRPGPLHAKQMYVYTSRSMKFLANEQYYMITFCCTSQTSQERLEVCAWRTTGRTTSQWRGTGRSPTVDLPSRATSLKSATCLDRRGSKPATSTPTGPSSKQPTCLKASSIRSEFMPSTRSDRASKPPNWISRAKPKCRSVSYTSYWLLIRFLPTCGLLFLCQLCWRRLCLGAVCLFVCLSVCLYFCRSAVQIQNAVRCVPLWAPHDTLCEFLHAVQKSQKSHWKFL